MHFLSFLFGMVTSAVWIALGVGLAVRFSRVKPPPEPEKPYRVYDRSDAAVAAMERTRKEGRPARAPGGHNVTFEMQAEVPD